MAKVSGSFSFEDILRLCLPLAFLCVLFLLDTNIYRFPFLKDYRVPFFLMGIYYWAIYRPTLVPPWFVFFAGLLIDLMTFVPIGLNALVFVVIQWMISDQRRFLLGQGFGMIWFLGSIVIFTTLIFQWAIFGLPKMIWPPLEPVILGGVISIGVFPFIYISLHLTHKILPANSANTLKERKS